MLEDSMACFQSVLSVSCTSHRLLTKRLGLLEDSLACFQSVLVEEPHSPETAFQVARLFEDCGDAHQAIEWFDRVLRLLPNDAGVLCRLGALHDGWAQHADLGFRA
jgi:tetratricopeptide (TPR) repeat protein